MFVIRNKTKIFLNGLYQEIWFSVFFLSLPSSHKPYACPVEGYDADFVPHVDILKNNNNDFVTILRHQNITRTYIMYPTFLLYKKWSNLK